MVYTQKTREILSFIDKYGFITSNIASRIFFKEQNNSYISACRKLRTMCRSGVLIRYMDNGEYIYQQREKRITLHRKLLLDFYSRLYEKTNVLYFNVEERWDKANKRNDGHMIYEKDGVMYGILIEVDYSHYTSKDKLDSIYYSGEVQEWYKDRYCEEYFPSIVIISLLGDTDYGQTEYDYTSLDFSFKDIYDKMGLKNFN